MLCCTSQTNQIQETDPFDTSRRALAQRAFRSSLTNLRSRIQSPQTGKRELRKHLAELLQLQRAKSDAGSLELFQQIRELVYTAELRLGQNETSAQTKSSEIQPSFCTPIKQPTISSSFGMREDPFGSARLVFHNGVDFVAARGTPVRASAHGHVIFTGFRDDGCGLAVSILHDGDFVSDYCHLSSINVVMLARVQQGATIGRVGSTGRTNGPHLHWGIWHRGVALDPMRITGGGAQ